MITGVLLAGGASTRMGRNKALMPANGESFIAHGIRSLWTVCDTVVVVLGAQSGAIRQRTEEEFAALAGRGGFDRQLSEQRRDRGRLEVHFVVNRAWRRGMYSSVREGLRAAADIDSEAILLSPVDHPSVRPRTVNCLGEVLAQALRACRTPRERERFSYALVPRYRGRRGHPVGLSPALARAVCEDGDAEHLNDAIRRNARLVGYLDVPDPGVVRNRNTPDD
jgi:CTP:molybdopterin cytidylyltransferase MocA